MLVLCLLEYLKLNSRRERGESHFFIYNIVVENFKKCDTYAVNIVKYNMKTKSREPSKKIEGSTYLQHVFFINLFKFLINAI